MYFTLVPSSSFHVYVPSAGDDKSEGEGGEKEEKGKDEGDDLVVVAPRMFKHLVGQGHVEFSSGRQQDAAEYMQHLLEVINQCSFLFLCDCLNVFTA